MSGENTLQIKTYKLAHTCNRSYKNRQVTSAFLASKYVNKFRTTPTWKINEFKDTVKDDCVVEVSKMKCYKVRKQALVQLEGTNAEQYTKLWDCATELIRTNPGSRVDINVWRPQLQIKPRFQRMFVCLDGIIRGFLAGMMPLIGLDACHLKGPCQGQLFATVGCDGNNMMYPIAYAMAESENKESWTWFVENLFECIGTSAEHGWTFITDQQKIYLCLMVFSLFCYVP
ncbi:hypothetical protein ACSBR1_011116 [Camellia fascicularis]